MAHAQACMQAWLPGLQAPKPVAACPGSGCVVFALTFPVSYFLVCAFTTEEGGRSVADAGCHAQRVALPWLGCANPPCLWPPACLLTWLPAPTLLPSYPPSCSVRPERESQTIFLSCVGAGVKNLSKKVQ